MSIEKSKLSRSVRMAPVVTVFILLFSITLNPGQCYYLSPLSLEFDEAKQFCIDQCGSNLASIHNASQFNDALNTIIYSPIVPSYPNLDVWIGLRTYNGYNNFFWVDNTAFNFGMDVTGGVYPWTDSKWYKEPSDISGKTCGQIWINANYSWDDTSCSTKKRALCNHCDGKLNKYYSYLHQRRSESATIVRYINQSLASLHSERDFEEMRKLCALKRQQCHIGLNGSRYDDATNFDYATNLTKVQYKFYILSVDTM